MHSRVNSHFWVPGALSMKLSEEVYKQTSIVSGQTRHFDIGNRTLQYAFRFLATYYALQTFAYMGIGYNLMGGAYAGINFMITGDKAWKTHALDYAKYGVIETGIIFITTLLPFSTCLLSTALAAMSVPEIQHLYEDAHEKLGRVDIRLVPASSKRI